LGKDRPSPSNVCLYTHGMRASEREMIEKSEMAPGLSGADRSGAQTVRAGR
jgi:hypothetical protein